VVPEADVLSGQAHPQPQTGQGTFGNCTGDLVPPGPSHPGGVCIQRTRNVKFVTITNQILSRIILDSVMNVDFNKLYNNIIDSTRVSSDIIDLFYIINRLSFILFY
jgi:hypothetical protein